MFGSGLKVIVFSIEKKYITHAIMSLPSRFVGLGHVQPNRPGGLLQRGKLGQTARGT